jgi:hypothetical protein
MRPALLGFVLILHAFAHAGAGTWAAGRHSPWVVVPAWLLSMCGFLAAGFGVLGVDRLRAWAAPASAVAAVASLVLFRLAGFSLVVLVGLAFSVVLAMLVRWWSRCAHPEIHTPTIATSPALAAEVDRPSLPRRAVTAVAWLFLAYTALLIVVRPWHHQRGSTEVDSDTSRLAFHTRGEGSPSFRGVILAPLGFYLLEPAHFILERGIAANASRPR